MSDFSAADYQHMARALQLAKKGRFTTKPNPNVGCVIVGTNDEYAEGWHEKAGAAHAEVNALAQINNPEDSTCYVTLEPCNHQGKTGPCAEALIEAKPQRVVIAMQDPNPLVAGKGMQRLQEAGISVSLGLLEQQAQKINKGFIQRMQTGLPYVRCKQAVSIDARTALQNGESKWITSSASRKDVHELRALSGAIITGSETVLNDDPALTVRDFTQTFIAPLRVVIDRRLRTSADAKICNSDAKTVIFTESKDDAKLASFKKQDVEVINTISITPKSVLKYLVETYQINDVLIEAGATLSGAFMQAGLIDELIVYQANKLMGNNAQAMLHLDVLDNMQDVNELNMIDRRQFAQDTRTIYQVVK